MSNVVPLFKATTKEDKSATPVDIRELISNILDWTEKQGVEVKDNDLEFMIKCRDLVAHIQSLALKRVA